MGFIAYISTCLPTGKKYVGITTRGMERRWREHSLHAPKGKSKLARAITKYGHKNFSIAAVAQAYSFSDLLELEVLLITQHKTKTLGLNSTQGGDGVLGLSHSQESVEAMSISRKKVWTSASYRSKISASQKAAWLRKSTIELDSRRERARVTLALCRPFIIAARKAKAVPKKPYVGKGHNMRIKTHCPSGHGYTFENTYTDSRGSRVCKVCKRRTRNVSRDRKRIHQVENRVKAGGKKY